MTRHMHVAQMIPSLDQQDAPASVFYRVPEKKGASTDLSRAARVLAVGVPVGVTEMADKGLYWNLKPPWKGVETADIPATCHIPV